MCLFKNGNITLINGICLFIASSRNGGEHLSAKLDGQYKRLRRIVGHGLAHKAQWHNKCTILVYARADFPFHERCLLK